jgi:thiamine biosynthesis lipoprotein
MIEPVKDIPLRFAHEAMGTTFEVIVAGSDEKYAGQVSQAVFQEIDRLEMLFSRFNTCSEIGQINRLKPGAAMSIGLETYECLKTASLIREETGGAFDVNFRCPRKEESFEVFRAARGFGVKVRKSLLSSEEHGVDLDLGGIGKGYALDKAQDILRDWGVERALLHGGTSTALAIGSAPGLSSGERGWPVGVGGIWALADVPKRLLLQERALSGSGTEVKGRHIQDPRTDRPAATALGAWVSHPRAAVADALSTAFMVMKPQDVRGYCEAHVQVWALLILDRGVYQTFNNGIFRRHP